MDKMELENYHFATIPVKLIQARIITNLKEGRERKFDEEQDIYIVSKHLSINYLIIIKRKIMYSEKTGNLLTQWINIHITNKRQSYIQCLQMWNHKRHDNIQAATKNG